MKGGRASEKDREEAIPEDSHRESGADHTGEPTVSCAKWQRLQRRPEEDGLYL